MRDAPDDLNEELALADHIPSESVATETLAALIELIRPVRRIVAFTGAGISTESGIPDYRGPRGVWATGRIPTIADFRENPETRRRYWDRRRTGYAELAARRPNDGHLALARLERVGLLSAVVTQNIDGLHQKAGNSPERVVELHGSAHHIRCLNCGRSWPADAIQERLQVDEPEPRCDVCFGPLRAATVLFGEALPAAALQRAAEVSASCDLTLVIGSSLVVHPAAQLPLLAKRHGAKLAIVNRTPTPLDREADLVLAGEAGPVLRALTTALVGWSI